MSTCRHRNVWILPGRMLWCYECGAWRGMRWRGELNELEPRGPWCKPTGPGGDNPVETYQKAMKSWKRRYERTQ